MPHVYETKNALRLLLVTQIYSQKMTTLLGTSRCELIINGETIHFHFIEPCSDLNSTVRDLMQEDMDKLDQYGGILICFNMDEEEFKQFAIGVTKTLAALVVSLPVTVVDNS